MNIWKFNSAVNGYTAFLQMEGQSDDEDMFLTDGTLVSWPSRPRIHPHVEKNKKKQMPLADLSYISPGTILLNRKAWGALKDFLSPFGQLLEVECMNEGGLLGDRMSEIYYFYNVTNIIPCIDFEKSEKIGHKILKEAFFADRIPTDAQIFRDPVRLRTQIYLTEPAKEQFTKLIADAGLVGGKFFQ